MGLVPGFVFSINRRALLAVLAIGISVSYALVAGAATGGLSEAQQALSGELADTVLVGIDEDYDAFNADQLEPRPDQALALLNHTNGTLYTATIGPPVTENASHALAPRTHAYKQGTILNISGQNVTIQLGDLPLGAQPDWIGINQTLFETAGGPTAPTAHVAVWENPPNGTHAQLEAQGLRVQEAPGAFPFYEAGALQLVSAVQVTVIASALVVGLLATTVVSMEINAKRESFATLQLYAGKGLVRRLIAARGATLLTAGHLLGVTLTLGVLFLVERAGAAALALPTDYLLTAITATFGGGLLALILPIYRAGKTLTTQDLSDDEPADWTPRILRLTLASWRTLIPLAIAAAVLAGSLGVIFGAVDMPNQLFGTDDANVIADTSNNPLRGSAPAFLGKHLGGVDGYDGSSPEIFAPTRIQNQPVMVRGVHWAALTTMEDIHVTTGKAPTAPGTALAGERLANQLDLRLGQRITLPSPYTASAHTVTLTGIGSSPGLLGDELLVPLPTARSMTGLDPGQVHIVRYREDPTFAPNATQARTFPSGLEATELTLTPENPVPFQQATATVSLVNFADTTKSRQLTLRVNQIPVADTYIEAGPRQTTFTHLTFQVPNVDTLNLEVNPQRETQTGTSAYQLDVLRAVTLNSTFTVTVTHENQPASGVDLELGDQTATTDQDGQARLQAQRLGNQTLTATGPEGFGARSIQIVTPLDLYRAHVIVQDLAGPTQIQQSPWHGAAYVENIGAEAFQGNLTLPVNGNRTNITQLSLPSGQTTRIPLTLDLEEGDNTIGTPQTRLTVTVGQEAPADGTDGSDGTDDGDGGDGAGGGDGGTGSSDDIRDLLEERAQSTTQPGSTQDVEPIQAFLGETFQHFDAAVTVVTLATLLHAGLIALVAVRRDIEENAPTLASLASLGANRAQLRTHALKEYLLIGTTAAILGTTLGLGLVHYAANQAWIGGFGHALVPRTHPGFALRIAGAALLTTLAAALIAVEQTRTRTLATLLTQGPTRTTQPPLATLLNPETTPNTTFQPIPDPEEDDA